MGKPILLSLLAASGAVALTVGGGKRKSLAQDVALRRIEELHRRDVEASKAQDLRTLLSLWTDDGVLLVPGRAPIIGKEALKAYLKAEAEATRTYTIARYEQQWKEIKIAGDWAFEWGFFDGEAHPVSGGQPIKQKAKMMRILKRQKDGSWKCARAIYHEDPVEK
jgi:uncharacterized protein (TIGR02246 family)